MSKTTSGNKPSCGSVLGVMFLPMVALLDAQRARSSPLQFTESSGSLTENG